MSRLTLNNCDAIEGTENLPDNSVHLTVTSPPYDAIRDYNGIGNLDLNELGKSLLKKTVDGGVCVIVIQDGTKNFKKSGTTARTICNWIDAGWNLWEVCIYDRPGRPGAWWSQRFRVDHEYILIFFKGEKPRYFSKEHMKIPTLNPGVKFHGTQRTTDGSLIQIAPKVVADTKCPGTILKYSASTTERNKTKNLHPAPFPDKLAKDMILAFSKENDTVYDPFVGSGTTAIMAANNNRHFIGGDISEEYLAIAMERIKRECV